MTKEYSSVTSLKKPFKTPFKTPFKVPLQAAPQARLPEKEVHEDVVVFEEPDFDLDNGTLGSGFSSPPRQSCKCSRAQLLGSADSPISSWSRMA